MEYQDTGRRVFFTFHIAPNIAGKILSHAESVFKNSVEFYPPENIHLTIKFVGEVSDEELRELIFAAEKIASELPPVHIRPESFFIEDGRLRLSLEPNIALALLHNRILDAMETRHIGKIDPKMYLPHMTLGRVKEDFYPPEILGGVNLDDFAMNEFILMESAPGQNQIGQYTPVHCSTLSGKNQIADLYNTIILPTRSQPDTIVAIFILKKFGEGRFPGIKNAAVDFWQVVPEGETEDSLDEKGVLLIDLGSGRFDHHAEKIQTTASDLIAEYLGIKDDVSLAKLLEYARRDDFFGKGTISEDPLDRAFGLSALIAALNKSLVKNPGKVVDYILPLIIAHHNEEERRTKDLPKEFEEKLASGDAETFETRQRGKKLKVVMITSDSGSLAGYLRSQSGGKFDVVAQWLPSGHINILTRPVKRIDLRSLTALIRMEEAAKAGMELNLGARDLARFGRIKEIPEWYYDPATNSIQNGGLNPKEISPTKISKPEFKKILDLGLSEKLWSPLAQFRS